MKNLPNHLSLLRILLTPVFILLLFGSGDGSRLLSLLVFTFAALTDWYDGYAARKYGYISNIGKFLDPLADKVLVLSALICFSVLGYIPVWMVVVIVIRDLTITTLRVYAALKGDTFTTNYFAKMKTFGQMVIIYIMYILFIIDRTDWEGSFWSVFRALHDSHLILILLYGITFITIFSGIQYLIINRRAIRHFFTPSDNQ